MIACPVCGGNTRVLDTRTTAHGEAAIRRLECLRCHARRSSVEQIMDLAPNRSTGRKRL